MILIDSNLLIYLSKGAIKRGAFPKTSVAYSTITKIETLGHPQLPTSEFMLLRQLMAEYEHLPPTDDVAEKAIELRQLRRIKLGDAIIAATAITYGLELWTNDQGFKTIPGLRLHYPLEVAGK